MNRTKQKGITFFGWMIVLGLIAFFVLLGLRLVPMYIEGAKIRGSLDSLQQEPFITKKTKRDLIKLINNRFNIEDISAIEGKDIEINKKGGILTLIADYEIRKNFMGNIDLVTVFNEKVEIVAN